MSSWGRKGPRTRGGQTMSYSASSSTGHSTSPAGHTTTARKGRKKRTLATVPLPRGVRTKDQRGRLIIMPAGDRFIPSDQAVRLVKDSMSPHFTQGWPSWEKVPRAIRDCMFEEFKNKCSWDSEYNDLVRGNFERKPAQRPSDGLSKFRRFGTVPGWIYLENWATLKKYWESEEFIRQSEQAKKNRASAKGGSLHTCGSVSLATHRARYEAEHGPISDIDFYRLFHHVYDDNGNVTKWVEPRAQQLDENYKAVFKQWVESQGSVAEEGALKPTPEEEIAMFVEAGGGYSNKGRAYGLGPARYKTPSRVGIINAYVSSSSYTPQNVDPVLQGKLVEMEKGLEDQRKEIERIKEMLADLEARHQAADEKMSKLEALFSTYFMGKGAWQ